MGQWDRALTQLQVAGEMDASTLAMMHTYRAAIQCEILRAEVFIGHRSPLIFGQPERWLALLVQALQLTAEGRHAQAQPLRDEAFEAAPATGGSLVTRADTPAPSAPPAPGTAFQWIADADSRLGPVLEAVVSGRYYWIPFARIRRVDVEPPQDLRDLVWSPAHFVWTNGGEMPGFIPTRYAGSESLDDALRLARKTDWLPAAEGVFLGQGQRVLTTDTGEYPLLEVRRIQLNTGEPQPDEPNTATGSSSKP
jgi:type VI secretion system protein ImpE